MERSEVRRPGGRGGPATERAEEPMAEQAGGPKAEQAAEPTAERVGEPKAESPAETTAEQAADSPVAPRSERRRLLDGLIGAGVATCVLVLAIVVLLLVVTRPASDDPVARPGDGNPTAPSEPAGASPPADLATGDLWWTGLALDAGTLATPDGVLHDVVVSGEDVRTGAAGLTAGSLTVVATVPFDLVAEQVGSGVVVGPVPGHPDQAAVYRSFEAAGRVLDVEARGTVLARDGLLVIEPRTIDIGGPDVLAELFGAVARRLVTIEQAIEGVPEGLVLTDLTVQDDGFRATLTGTDVRIEP